MKDQDLKLANKKEKTKKLQWIQNRPYCYNKDLKKLIRFKSLHLQGPCKEWAESYQNIS